MMMRLAAVIPAGGEGRRMDALQPDQGVFTT